MRTTLVTVVAALAAATAALHATYAVQAAGKASGTLTVGTSATRLAHAYAFQAAEVGGQAAYRILVTDEALTPAAIAHAAAAGADDGARQELAVELADRQTRGLEAVVGADRTIVRLNVYSSESAMGLMLLTKGEFEATTLDARQITGRFWTPAPIDESRIGRTIRYDVTFAARVHGAP